MFWPPQYHVKFLEGTDWDAETYLIDMTNTFYSCHVFSLRLFQVCEWYRRTSVFTDVDVCKPLNEHIFPWTRMYAYNSCMCKSVVLYGAQVIFQKHLFNDWIESTCPTWFGTTGRPRKSEGLTSPWISKPWYVTFRAISHTSGGRKSSWWSRTHQCGNSGCKSVGCSLWHTALDSCAHPSHPRPQKFPCPGGWNGVDDPQDVHVRRGLWHHQGRLFSVHAIGSQVTWNGFNLGTYHPCRLATHVGLCEGSKQRNRRVLV